MTHERRATILWLVAGTFVMAAATNLFFVPADVVAGGFTGLAMFIRHLTEPMVPGGIPVWVSNVVLNIPLMIASVKMRGWRYIRRTLFASAFFSVWLAVIPDFAISGSDLFLAAILGGLLMGVGCGMVFLGRATTGGTDTLAALIQRKVPHLPVAKILPAVDGVVILMSVFIFGVEKSGYAIVSVILSGIVADRFVSGHRNACLAYIISDKYLTIGNEIMKELDRGATVVPVKGMYTSEDRNMLICAASIKESVILKDIVADIDPTAFCIITDAEEIRGEGFLRYTHDEL